MKSNERVEFLYRGMKITLDKAAIDRFRFLTGHAFDDVDADLYMYNYLVRTKGKFPKDIERLEIHEIESIIDEGLFMENTMWGGEL
jgi:hypothetical protein